jgi:hypothetical protein
MSVEALDDSETETDAPVNNKFWRYHLVCRDCSFELLLTANSKMVSSIAQRHREERGHRTASKQIDGGDS